MQGRPAYLRIADALRDRIRDGGYPPGARLPTIAVLATANGVSQIVVRQAIALLRAEGLVETRRGGGTVVRARPATRRVAMERYRVEMRPLGTPATPDDSPGGNGPGDPSDPSDPSGPGNRRDRSDPGDRSDPDRRATPTPWAEPATSFTHDQRIRWHEYRLDRTYSKVAADPELAALFELPAHTTLLRRHFVFHARGKPQQISVNYLPWDLVADTPVADPDREPWPGGTPAQLCFLGRPPTRIEESVGSRMPTPEESETLRLAAGVPVLTVTRRMISGTDVLEVCRDIVLPADRVILDYSLDL